MLECSVLDKFGHEDIGFGYEDIGFGYEDIGFVDEV